MTEMDVRFAQGAAGAQAWPVADAAAIVELQEAVARLTDVVAALAGTLSVTVTNQPTIPAPQTDALTNTQLRAAPVPVATGLSIPQPQTDALTDAELRATPVPVSTGLVIPQPQTDALTNAQLRATPVPVNTGLTIPTPQTDGLTDAELRATPVAVDTGLTIPTPQTDALTDAQLRAAPVPVSTGLSIPAPQTDALTDAELRATPVPVATGLVIPQPQTNALTNTELRGAAVTVQQQIGVDFISGKVRTAGAKVTVPSGGSGFLCLTNPAGSGKVISLQQFALGASANSDVNFRFDTVLASPTTVAAFMPNRAVAGSTVGVAQTSTSAPASAGTVLSPVYRLAADIMILQDFPVVLMPGQSVAVVASSPTLGGAFDLYATATWTEG